KRDVLESERAIREGLDDVREANHGPKDSRERGPAEREPGLRLAFLSEGLLEVRDEVPGVLDAAAQAHVPVGDSHGGARLGAESPVRGEPRLRDEALDAGQARRMRNDPEPAEELLGGPDAALDLKPQHAAESGH